MNTEETVVIPTDDGPIGCTVSWLLGIKVLLNSGSTVQLEKELEAYTGATRAAILNYLQK